MILAFVLSLLACDSEKPAPQEGGGSKSFHDATTAQRQAAAVVAMGYLPLAGFLTILPAGADVAVTGGACPTATLDGDVRVLEGGGCTGPSGYTYDGALRGLNMPNFLDLDEEQDPSAPMELDFDGWSVGDVVVDGVLWQSALAPEADWTASADMTVETPALGRMTWIADMACAMDGGDSVCASSGEMRGSVEGFGEFEIVGELRTRADGSPAGELALVGGVDALVLDLASMDAETGCVPATIGGEPVEPICLADALDIGEPGEPGPVEPGYEITGTSVSIGETLGLEAWTRGDVMGVEAEVRVGASTETELHPMVPVSSTGTDLVWAAELAEGAYAPGESTALDPVGNAADVAVKIRAFDEDGAVVACSFGGMVEGEPADWFDWSDCP